MLAAENAAERVRVFWQPGCSSCLRTKEFLSKNGVEYESINVHGNPAGMEALRKLGARSVPAAVQPDTQPSALFHPDCTVGSGSAAVGHRSDLLTLRDASAAEPLVGSTPLARGHTTGRESHPAPRAGRV